MEVSFSNNFDHSTQNFKSQLNSNDLKFLKSSVKLEKILVRY